MTQADQPVLAIPAQYAMLLGSSPVALPAAAAATVCLPALLLPPAVFPDAEGMRLLPAAAAAAAGTATVAVTAGVTN